ncbi:MAG: PEP-CTERM sorting domain-containing protein [Geobacteraceae bacterium]
MKKLVILTSVLAWMICMLPSMALAVPSFYSDRSTWETVVGDWADVDLAGQVADGDILSAGDSIALPEYPGNRSLSFDVDLAGRQVPTSWATWSGGEEPRLLYSGFGVTSVTGNFSGTVHAFGVEMEPNPFDAYLMVLFADGTQLQQLVSGDSGAKFFGFTSDLAITSLTMSSDVDFAFGRMVVDASPVPEPSTLLLLGGGILGLVYYGRRRMTA